MTTSDLQQLDLGIQRTLVSRVGIAAGYYRSASPDAADAALATYLASLERLAEYVSARTRGAEVGNEDSRAA